MDISFDLETLLCSYEFRKKLNMALVDRGFNLRIALIDKEGKLVPGDMPGVSPFPVERCDAMSEFPEDGTEYLGDTYPLGVNTTFTDEDR